MMNDLNVEQLLKSAAMLEKEADYEEALRLYNRVLEVDPDNETVHNRRCAIRNNTLFVVIEELPRLPDQYSTSRVITLDGNTICDCYSGNNTKVEVIRGKHRLAVLQRGHANNAVPREIAGYDFIVSEKEQTVYLRYTETGRLHFSNLAHEEGTLTNADNVGGCYVATAVYGAYDCPQVWTLRRFRDDTLAVTWYGRAFIKAYYAVSPNVVKWFGHTQWFKKLWRGKLDSMVSKLNANGVEDTPYNDRIW